MVLYALRHRQQDWELGTLSQVSIQHPLMMEKHRTNEDAPIRTRHRHLARNMEMVIAMKEMEMEMVMALTI